MGPLVTGAESPLSLAEARETSSLLEPLRSKGTRVGPGASEAARDRAGHREHYPDIHNVRTTHKALTTPGPLSTHPKHPQNTCNAVPMSL